MNRDRTGAVTEGNPDTSGLVGYTEYLTVSVDKEGNITEPVYAENEWLPDDYGFTSDYVINADTLKDGKFFCTKYTENINDYYAQDLRPYVHNGVVDVYLNWFRYVG